MNVPILVICHNNHKYVENTLRQISKINKDYYKNIQIIDNASGCKETINFLKSVDVKVIHNENVTPRIDKSNNIRIYNSLPEEYVLTDPDLELNENMPENFIEILSNLSQKYSCNRVGLALDISDFDKMYQTYYLDEKTIYEWESRYWVNKIADSDYELYGAAIDTTFCLINKRYESKPNYNLRIAGNFTAKHLPWYKENKIYNVYDNYLLNEKHKSSISTSKNLFTTYTEADYYKVNKNDELFFIKNSENDPNIHFWNNIYTHWENETFNVFDKYLNKTKIFVDIGAWIGTTAMYGSRKAKDVYLVEADKKSFEYLKLNMETNCINNYTLINKVIYNKDNIEIKFGKNKFMNNSKMNDSTSQIYMENESSDEFYLMETITIGTIIKNFQINISEVGLIKVDIEGGEEYILTDLCELNRIFKIPLYISFHYDWWVDKNLDRFNFLTIEQKEKIMNDPFISIIFE
jgi:FkbM family methyltransferase